MTRRRRSISISNPQSLELRIVPTVTVNFSAASGLLKLTGDGASDVVELDSQGTAGKIIVKVNGAAAGNFNNVKNINAKLGDGNDKLNFKDVNLPGNVVANLGGGADQMNFVGVDKIGGLLNANFGSNTGDFVNCQNNTLIVNGDTSFIGVADVNLNGKGDSFLDDVDDIDFKGKLTIRFGASGDVNSDDYELFFSNVNVFGTTLIKGTGRVERLDIGDSSFGGKFTATLADGNDELDVRTEVVDKNAFAAAVFFKGGDGNNDVAKIGNNNDFAQNPVVTGFETVS